MNKKSTPRMLFYDLEIFPNKGYFWPGRKYETNIIETIEWGGLASFAYKWDGDKSIQCLTREGKKTDRGLVKSLRKLFNEADIVVAHNGVAFDTKTTNTNIIKHDLIPPSPVKTIDTKLELRKHFRFDSNSLDDSARFLGVGRKLKHEGFDMWKECMDDQPAAWKEMARYNKHDVFLLEGVYRKLLPWIKTVNAANIAGRPELCTRPGCGGTELQARGFTFTQVGRFRRFQCQKCGGWCRATRSENVDKPKTTSV